MFSMINLLKVAEGYIHGVEPGSYAERFFALTPVVNNLFLEVKRLQLEQTDSQKLKIIAGTVSFWLWGQVIWSPVLAKVMEHLSFKWRTMTFISLTIYYIAAEKHIEYVRHL